jgi:hypothetical protein
MVEAFFRDMHKLFHSDNEEGDLKRQIVEVYDLCICRGLTPHDALAVAGAFEDAKRRRPGLAKPVH